MGQLCLRYDSTVMLELSQSRFWPSKYSPKRKLLPTAVLRSNFKGIVHLLKMSRLQVIKLL